MHNMTSAQAEQHLTDLADQFAQWRQQRTYGHALEEQVVQPSSLRALGGRPNAGVQTSRKVQKAGQCTAEGKGFLFSCTFTEQEANMRAVGIMVHGGPEALEVVALPEVHAGPGHVRVRIHAAAVNPTDTMARNGSRAEQQKVDPPPYVPGMDAAGIVDEVGAGVTTGVKVGDAVMAMVVPKGSHGAYREQIVLQARAVVPAPAGTTHVQACTLPMNGLTARQSLDLLGLSPGQTLAVTGAAGAYGGYVVQLAKAEGLTVIADASEADQALVKALGADIVVRRGDDVATRMLEHCPHGVDGLADGAVLNDKVISAVRDGGAFTSVRGFIGAPQRGIRFTVTSVRTYDGEFEKLDRLRQLVESGAVTLRVAATYPPERAAAAHRRLEAGGTRGRLVITF